MDHFNLFPEKQGIDNLLTEENIKESNRENDRLWLTKGLHSKRRHQLNSILDFDQIAPLENGNFPVSNYIGFAFQTGFNILQNPYQPGLIALKTHSKRTFIGWVELPVRIVRGGVQDIYPYTGKAWDLISIDYAPANHTGTTITLEGMDKDGVVIHTMTRAVSADTPQTIVVDFKGIHDLRIEPTVVGDQHPEATDAQYVHGIANMCYKL